MKKGPRRGPSQHKLSTLRGKQAPEQGRHLPEVGLEPGSSPCKSATPQKSSAQSEAGTTESEAQGVDSVHTLFCEHFEPQTIRV
jgi:hypothetical protein